MKATVFSNHHVIGTTDLIIGDLSMGHVYGTFIPNQFYFDHIQKYVWDFWKTSRPDYHKWHSLNINVRLENGFQLDSVGGITIDDIKDLLDEPKRIDIAGLHYQVLNDYFSAT